MLLQLNQVFAIHWSYFVDGKLVSCVVMGNGFDWFVVISVSSNTVDDNDPSNTGRPDIEPLPGDDNKASTVTEKPNEEVSNPTQNA